MNYNRTNYLLKKYTSKQPGEEWSKESKQKDQKKRRINEYLAISDVMMDSLNIVGNQRKEVKDIIKTVPLKQLHRKAKVETIILAICIYVKKSYSKKGVAWKRYTICKENNLTCDEFVNVLCNLVKYYRSKSYLKCGEVGEVYQCEDLET